MKKFIVGLLASAVLLSGCHGGSGFQAKSGGFHSSARPHGLLDHKKPLGHVQVSLYRHGHRLWTRDMGYGAVTNVGVTAMANDFEWAGPSGAPVNTLALAKNCASGTGTSPAAASDISLQTWDSVATVAGTQTLVSAANSQSYRVTCTIVYSGTEAVTEFGLFTGGTLSATTGTPWTAGSATTGTATGTPYTASSSTVQGEQQFIFIDTTKSPNIYGLVLSNSTGGVTVPAWYKVTDGTASGTFPANTDSLVIRPVMLDHKVFSAVNVSSGDSITFQYTLLLASGG